MTLIQQTSAAYFKSLSIIFFALVLGQVFFAASAYLFGVKADPPLAMQGNSAMVLVLIVFILMASSYQIGNLMFKRRIAHTKDATTLIQKMNRYREAIIIKMVIPEGVSILTSLCYFLTGEVLFMGFAVAMITSFLLLYPTKSGAAATLELTDDERRRIMDPTEIIAETKTQ